MSMTMPEQDEPVCRCDTLRPGDDCPVHPFDASQYRPAAEPAPPTDGLECTCPVTDPLERAATYTVRALGVEPHAAGCPRWGLVKTPSDWARVGRRRGMTRTDSEPVRRCVRCDDSPVNLWKSWNVAGEWVCDDCCPDDDIPDTGME